MRYLIIIIVLASACFLIAQTAEDYFHIGAHQLLNSQLTKAHKTVSAGLQKDPNNADLKRLLAIIEKELQEEEQQQQQDKQNDEQKEKEQKQEEQKQEQKQKSQEEKQKEEKKEDAEKMLKALLQKEKEEMKKEKEKMNVDRTKTGKYW